MKVPIAWLREFVDLPADSREIARAFGACGFAVEDLTDDVLDLDITANRPDCLSVYGIAREAAAAFRQPLKPAPGQATIGAGSGQKVPVSIGDAGCGRYVLAMADVTVGPSPSWLVDRLAAAGMRAINNVVDVTNYVMLELGHPMHAFDAAKLAGPEIRVRRARPGEKLTTLDGVDRTLEETMLVIADHDHAIALAGIMGGGPTEVSSETTRIALESAWFRPQSVRATSKRLGLKTEASARFERGADLAAPARAAARALALLAEIGGATSTGPMVDVHPLAIEARMLVLRRQRIARLLGQEIPDADVVRILRALAFEVTDAAEGWQVVPPSFRVDVAREADLVEEIGRHVGFDRIPATFPTLDRLPPPAAPGVIRARTVRRLLCGAGLQEAATFTFMEEAAAAPFGHGRPLVAIKNPLSEKFSVLRPSLLPGLVDALIYSRRRESADVRLFESGTVFAHEGERQRVGWVLTGSRGDHWSGSAGPVGFTDARGIAELLAGAFERSLEVVADETLPWFTPGRRARLRLDGADAGWVGEIAPAILSARGLGESGPVYGGEIDAAALSETGAPAIRKVDALPRHPSIVRDLSIIVDERLPAESVRGTIRAQAPVTLVAVREFDRYQGKGMPEGRVSLSLRLTFRAADRTLTDAEVQQAVDGIVEALAREHAAVLRGTPGRAHAE
jgi:phenylalanyl-tRNA synthetase beta chain